MYYNFPQSADPRRQHLMKRANHSPLMRAILNKSKGVSQNFCPFNCSDDQLDSNGYCHHLIGFTNGNGVYEPRIPEGTRVRVIGKKKMAMKPGDRMVPITTSARVYRAEGNPQLMVQKDVESYEFQEAVKKEQELLRMAEAIRNPVLEGEWTGLGMTTYDEPTPQKTGSKK